MSNTLAYYDQNADAFFERTVDADISDLYSVFLPLIPKGGKILDVGCGSGRDAKFFKEKGYTVVATDASVEMVKRSTAYIGQPTLYLPFDEIDFKAEFDGVWANASLPHLSSEKLLFILDKLYRALKVDGILYVSFKYGEGEYLKDGRLFNDQNEDSLRPYLEKIPGLQLISFVKAADTRNKVSTFHWLNCFARKVS